MRHNSTAHANQILSIEKTVEEYLCSRLRLFIEELLRIYKADIQHW